MALGGLGSFGMRILTGFRGEIARFVILGARCQGVNHLRVPLCPEVQSRTRHVTYLGSIQPVLKGWPGMRSSQ